MFYSLHFHETARVAVLLQAEILEICEHQQSVSELAKNSQLLMLGLGYSRTFKHVRLRLCNFRRYQTKSGNSSAKILPK